MRFVPIHKCPKKIFIPDDHVDWGHDLRHQNCRLDSRFRGNDDIINWDSNDPYYNEISMIEEYYSWGRSFKLQTITRFKSQPFSHS